jgi:hypothetical protein
VAKLTFLNGRSVLMRAALDSVSFQIRVETFDDCTMLFALSEFTHSVYGYSNVTGTTPFRFWEPN